MTLTLPVDLHSQILQSFLRIILDSTHSYWFGTVADEVI